MKSKGRGKYLKSRSARFPFEFQSWLVSLVVYTSAFDSRLDFCTLPYFFYKRQTTTLSSGSGNFEWVTLKTLRICLLAKFLDKGSDKAIAKKDTKYRATDCKINNFSHFLTGKQILREQDSVTEAKNYVYFGGLVKKKNYIFDDKKQHWKRKKLFQILIQNKKKENRFFENFTPCPDPLTKFLVINNCFLFQ